METLQAKQNINLFLAYCHLFKLDLLQAEEKSIKSMSYCDERNKSLMPDLLILMGKIAEGKKQYD